MYTLKTKKVLLKFFESLFASLVMRIFCWCFLIAVSCYSFYYNLTHDNPAKKFLMPSNFHRFYGAGDWSSSFLRFFNLWAERLSCPLSVFELELSLSQSEELDEDDELELLDESEAKPVLWLTLMPSAKPARLGSCSYLKKELFIMRQKEINFNVTHL